MTTTFLFSSVDGVCSCRWETFAAYFVEVTMMTKRPPKATSMVLEVVEKAESVERVAENAAAVEKALALPLALAMIARIEKAAVAAVKVLTLMFFQPIGWWKGWQTCDRRVG